MTDTAISPLRQRMIADMEIRGFPDRKRGRRPRTEERSPCRHHHEDGKKGSLEIDFNRPITEEELMKCLAPVIFIKSLTKDKK